MRSAIETLAVSAPAAALVELIRNVTPVQIVAPLFRHMADQLAHVGERDEIHDGRDGEPPGQLLQR